MGVAVGTGEDPDPELVTVDPESPESVWEGVVRSGRLNSGDGGLRIVRLGGGDLLST